MIWRTDQVLFFDSRSYSQGVREATGEIITGADLKLRR